MKKEETNINYQNEILSFKFISDYLNSLNVGKKGLIESEAFLIEKKLKDRISFIISKGKPKFSFIDLFAGIGGMRLGFEHLGGKCVMTSEIDNRALGTYFCNFGEVVEEKFRDITKVNEYEVPNHDILLGGFPCQAFSIAGERKGFDDTRGTLFFDIQRIIKAKRPKAVLLENVKGLLSHDKGKTFKTILRILSQELGYKVFYKVLNTMEYGNIPQTRERVYIVAFDMNILGDNVHFEFPESIDLSKKISDILETSQEDESLYYDRFPIYEELKKQMTKEDTIYQWRRVYVRENKSNACPTLTANMGTGGHNVPLVKEKNTGRIRKLTPRECARFQGFPENYYIPKCISNSHLYKQFGNSVSVPVVQRVAEEILKTLGDAGSFNLKS